MAFLGDRSEWVRASTTATRVSKRKQSSGACHSGPSPKAGSARLDLSTPKTAACGEEAISLTVVGHSSIVQEAEASNV